MSISSEPAEVERSENTTFRQSVESIIGAAIGWLPGLGLCAGLAVLASVIHGLPGLGSVSALMIAIVLGVAVRAAIGAPALLAPGIGFTLKRILRLGVMLLGLRITLDGLAAVGGPGLIVVVASLSATFFFTLWCGRLLGVQAPLVRLIATGTSVCGASAVIAANGVVKAPDEDAAYAVALVTIFGTLAMLIYPLLAAPLALDSAGYGIWSGASIHEVAQVVAAAFQKDALAGELATAAKLTRVALLAPVVLVLGLLVARGRKASAADSGAASPIPWFVVGFCVLALANSFEWVPEAPRSFLLEINGPLLTMAMAAMGLMTDVRRLRSHGLRPLLLGACSSAFIAAFSLGAIWMLL